MVKTFPIFSTFQNGAIKPPAHNKGPRRETFRADNPILDVY